MVGIYESDVKQALAINEISSKVGALPAANNAIALDIHYGVLMGIGARATEPLQELQFDLAAPVSAGATFISLTSQSSGIIVDQLIVLKSDNGEYNSYRTTSVSAGVIGVSPPVRYPISEGSLIKAVGVFYKNLYHPTVYGYRAIADYCLNSLRVRTLEDVFYLNKNSSSSTIVTDSSNAMLNMGSSVVASKNVTTTTPATQGVFYQGRLRKAGDYVFDVQTYSQSQVTVFVAIDGNASYQWEIAAGYSGVTSLRFTTKEQYQQVIIRVVANGNPATVNVVEAVNIYTESDIESVNYGRHCMLGDSWLTQDGIYQRLSERLPNATIVNKGVGGRKASDILAAFNTDVVGKYDFIWCLCGTNDYVGAVSAASYSNTIARIKGLSANNGARFIFLGSSVGPADSQSSEFDLSRQYAKLTDITDSWRLTEYTLMLPTTTVAAGASQVLVNMGYFDPMITITGYYTFGAGLSMRHKSTITAGSGTQILALNDNSLSLSRATYNIGASKIVDVFANNASGSPITYGGYITYLK